MHLVMAPGARKAKVEKPATAAPAEAAPKPSAE